MRAVALLVLYVLLACSIAAAAATPQTLSYQGVLRDDGAEIVADGTYEMTFWIYNVETGGLALWADTQLVPVTDGVFNVVLGSDTPLDLPFDEQYWLAITVEGEPQLAPRTPLTSVPYAYRAIYSDIADDGDWAVSGDDVYRIGGGVGVGTASPDYDLDVRRDEDDLVGIRITNLNTGSASREAVVFENEDGPLAGLGVYDDDHVYARSMMLYNNRPSGYIRFNTAGLERVRIENNGRVGIGIAIPSQLLDVAGTIKTLGFQMPVGAAAGYVLASDASGNGYWTSLSTMSDGDWYVSGSNVYSAVSGNVGVGTSTPLDKLHVNGYIRLDQGAGNGNAIRYVEGGVLKWALLYRPWVNDSLTIIEEGSNVRSMSFEGGTGNVGVKTESPVTDFHVVGDTQLDGDLHVNGAITSSGVTTHTLTVPVAAFTPSFPSATDWVNNGGQLYSALGDAVTFVAPVMLPDGATVTAVTHHYIDDSTLDSSCELNRWTLRGYAQVQMADVPSAGDTNAGGSTTDTTIVEPVIDNSTYAYYIRLIAWDGIRTNGVTIEYTTTTVN